TQWKSMACTAPLARGSEHGLAGLPLHPITDTQSKRAIKTTELEHLCLSVTKGFNLDIHQAVTHYQSRANLHLWRLPGRRLQAGETPCRDRTCASVFPLPYCASYGSASASYRRRWHLN